MKKQVPVLQRKQKENQVNKKAILWIGIGLGVIIVAMTVLLVVNG